MSNLFNESTSWIVNRPGISIFLLLVITAISLLGYQSSSLFDELFGAEAHETDGAEAGEVFDTPPDVQSVSLNNADAILVAESKQFFTPKGAKAMRAVVEALESLPHVDSVFWLDEIPVINIFGLPEPLLPQNNSSPTIFNAAKKKAHNHPLVAGQFLSDDGEMMLLMINFDYLMIEDDRSCKELLDEVATTTADSFAGVEIDFLTTGRVPFFLTAIETHESNRLKYQIIAYSMIAIMSLILFRGFTAVLIVAIAPAIGVFWTLGIIRFFDFQDSPFNDVVLPILISLVGFTDGVHLIVQIRRNRAGGLSAFEAAKKGIHQVGLACGLTSLTTAIGFGSLSLAHHEIVREFGGACVIGVVLTFVAVITVIPLACASWLGNRVHIGHDKGLIDKNLNRISHIIDWVLQRTKLLSILGILTTFVLIAISLTLTPDERQANALPDSSDAAVAIRKLDKAMGGLEFSSVDIRWAADIDERDPVVLEVISKIDDFLDGEELIGHPLSIRNFLDALPGEGADADRMSMLELLPPPLKRAFYTPEYRTANVSFRVQDLGIASYGAVFQRLTNHLDSLRLEYPKFEFGLSGPAIWRWENLYQIVVDLATSLGTASFIIFVVLSLAYQSFRVGLISIIPNLFPLAVAGTYLVCSGQNLEIVMVCAFTCCLGIAVDDTIHFLTRYLEERKQADSEEVAIRNAFTGVGTALIMTTTVLVAGFLTVQFSDAREHRIFASMGAITVAAALFGDLIFLPAILARFNRRKADSNESDSPNTENA